MLTREEVYVEGLPAEEAFAPFVEFALAHAGRRVVDLGCGYGAYAKRLQELGKEVRGVDADGSYVARARASGVDAVQADAAATRFADGEFDTALLFEVLEHVESPEAVLAEALRVARRNVLVTVPDMTHYESLRAHGLTYWHLVTTDHVNFFAREDLRELAERVGAKVTVVPAEPIHLFDLLAPGTLAHRLVWRLCRHGRVQPVAYRRLYSIFERTA